MPSDCYAELVQVATRARMPGLLDADGEPVVATGPEIVKMPAHALTGDPTGAGDAVSAALIAGPARRHAVAAASGRRDGAVGRGGVRAAGRPPDCCYPCRGK